MATVDPAWITAAVAACEGSIIPPSVVVAQFILESGWGEHMPPGSNNPFGEKALPGQPSVTVRTREVNAAGQSYFINAPFRVFPSLTDAFVSHAVHLMTSKHYAPARACLPDVDGFCNALTGVYSTDPHYGATLISIINAHGLKQYDKGPT